MAASAPKIGSVQDVDVVATSATGSDQGHSVGTKFPGAQDVQAEAIATSAINEAQEVTSAFATQRVAPGNVNDHLNVNINGIVIDKDSLAVVMHIATLFKEHAPILAQVRAAGAVLEKEIMAIETESTSDGGSDLRADFQGLIVEPAIAWLPQSESVEMILKSYDKFYDLPDDDDETLDWFPPFSCQSLSIHKGSGGLFSPDYPEVDPEIFEWYPPLSCQSLSIDKGSGGLLSEVYDIPEIDPEVLEWDELDGDDFGFHDYSDMPGLGEPDIKPWKFPNLPSWRSIMIWTLQMIFYTTDRDGKLIIGLNRVGAPGRRPGQVDDPRGLTPAMRRLDEDITVDSGAGASVAVAPSFFLNGSWKNHPDPNEDFATSELGERGCPMKVSGLESCSSRGESLADQGTRNANPESPCLPSPTWRTLEI